MPLETLLFFVPACFALNMVLGPNNLLSIKIGARYGVFASLIAGAGRLVAFIIMIVIAALGMGALLMAYEYAFTVAKFLGAAYLIWLGIKIARSQADLESERTELGEHGIRKFIQQEFLVAIGNPKAILIFTAFFPQFVTPEKYWESFIVLGAVFLILELLAIATYAYAGTQLGKVIRNTRGARWINRISGGMMITFGALLAFAKRPAA